MARTRAKALLPADIDLDDVRAVPGAGVAQQAFHEAPSEERTGGSLKETAVATTLYLLPKDHKRLKTLAVNGDISLQTLLLNAIDLLLTRDGLPPCERWDTRRKQR